MAEMKDRRTFLAAAGVTVASVVTLRSSWLGLPKATRCQFKACG